MPDGKARTFGLRRGGPEPRATRAGQPLRPLTLPNLVGYLTARRCWPPSS